MDLRSRSCGEGHAREEAREISPAVSVCSLVRDNVRWSPRPARRGCSVRCTSRSCHARISIFIDETRSSRAEDAKQEQERTVSTLTPAMLDLVPPPGVLPIRPSSGLGEGWREGVLDELAVWAGGTASDGWVNESVASSSSS